MGAERRAGAAERAAGVEAANLTVSYTRSSSAAPPFATFGSGVTLSQHSETTTERKELKKGGPRGKKGRGRRCLAPGGNPFIFSVCFRT